MVGTCLLRSGRAEAIRVSENRRVCLLWWVVDEGAWLPPTKKQWLVEVNHRWGTTKITLMKGSRRMKRKQGGPKTKKIIAQRIKQHASQVLNISLTTIKIDM